jgi:hypothetical protein
MDTETIKNEVLDTVRKMNDSWTQGWHEEEFRQYIHPDAVAIVPCTPGRLVGREAYVAGWRGFCEAAVVHNWHETDHMVNLHANGRAAVVTYLFAMTFDTNGQRVSMQGRDMFFLVKEGRRWLVAADQFSPEPQA